MYSIDSPLHVLVRFLSFEVEPTIERHYFSLYGPLSNNTV